MGLTFLENSWYPRMDLFMAARRLQFISEFTHPSDEAGNAELRRKKMRYLGQAAADPDFAGGHQRYYLAEIPVAQDASCRLSDEWKVFVREMEATPHADPWITNMVLGIAHMEGWWEFRYSGGASTVTKENRKVVGQELGLARAHFCAAHALHPEFPEAAEHMIVISMISHDAVNPRQWFDRAVAAQFDYMPAYDSLLYALRARWGGSHEAMVAFGIDCLNTKRFDTRVPRFVFVALRAIGTETEDWRAAYRLPGAYRSLCLWYAGQLAEPQKIISNEYSRTEQAVVAWAAGQYREARTVLDGLSNRFDAIVFRDYHVQSNLVAGEIRLYTGPFSNAFERAERSFGDGQSLASLPLFEDLLKGVTNDPGALAVVRDRLAILRMKDRFDKGEWVDLTPDAQLSGWDNQGGRWSVGGAGVLKGVSQVDDTWLLLFCKLRIGGDYEIRGETEAPFTVGIALGCHNGKDMWGNPDFCGFLVNASTNVASIRECFSWYKRDRKTDLSKRNRILVQVRGGKVTASVNGAVVFDREAIPEDWWSPEGGRIGVGGAYWRSRDCAIAYRNLQLRRLANDAAELNSKSSN